MSAPNQAELEAAFDSTIRVFPDVEQALRWYVAHTPGPRRLRAASMERGGAPPPARVVNQVAVTSNAIRHCVTGVRNWDLLIPWYSGFLPEEQLARHYGFPSRYSFHTAMKWTERELRVRMKERGLVR